MEGDYGDLLCGGGDDSLANYLCDNNAELLASFRDEPTFASADNHVSALQYINQALANLGTVSVPLKLSSSNPKDNAAVLNCLNDLINQRQKDLADNSDLRASMSRAQCDSDNMRSNMARLKQNLESSQRELGTMTAKERSARGAITAEKERSQTERNHLSKQIKEMQQRDTQYQHEIRKKERDYSKVQEKLNNLLKSKDQGSKAGIEIVNSIQSSGAGRAQWNLNKSRNLDEDFQKQVLQTYEMRQRDLARENDELKAVLEGLQEEVQELHGMHRASLNRSQSGQGGPNESFDEMCTEEQLRLPFDMIRDDYEESMRQRIGWLKTKISEQIGDESDLMLETSPDVFRERIRELKGILAEQEHIIQMSLNARNSPQKESANNESRYDNAWSDLETEKELLADKEKHLADERVLLQRAMDGFARQRKELNAEKRDLEQERTRWILNQQPQTPVDARKYGGGTSQTPGSAISKYKAEVNKLLQSHEFEKENNGRHAIPTPSVNPQHRHLTEEFDLSTAVGRDCSLGVSLGEQGLSPINAEDSV